MLILGLEGLNTTIVLVSLKETVRALSGLFANKIKKFENQTDPTEKGNNTPSSQGNQYKTNWRKCFKKLYMSTKIEK